jgi:SAM-dependent methyltransferase
MNIHRDRYQGLIPRDYSYGRTQPKWIDDTGYPPSGRLDLDAGVVDTRPEKAAHLFGYESPKEVADMLPEGAHVADAGAGASAFGNAVARLREDITWTNIDASYSWEPIRERLAAHAPPNLRFLAADLVELPIPEEAEKYDFVFSYHVFPHIIMENRASGLVAIRNVLQLARAGGRLAIGPVARYTKLERPPRAGNDVVVMDTPETPAELDELTTQVFQAVRLKGLSAYLQKRINMHMRQPV